MKNLIVCCDGTWNTPDNEDDGTIAPTNVFKLFNAVDLESTNTRQLTRYQSGVGTEGGFLSRTLGGLVGRGLDEDIRDCYHWLAKKYENGDKLFLFGFSRGAFTVRSLAGMICRLGIVKLAADDDPDGIVKRVYRQGYRERRTKLRGLEFHENSNRVHFVGVWDTVGALGIPDDKVLLDLFDNPSRYQFHDTTLSPNVEYARHAVAIDEKRGSFTPTLWDEKNRDNQNVKQLWFPGVHSDVGGGYKEHGLSDGALEWMIDESKKAGMHYLGNIVDQISPNSLDVLHESRTGLMKLLTTAPRAIPSLTTQKERFHSSVEKRRKRPPIGQLAYLRERRLAQGKEVEFDVYAKQTWNWTGIYLKAGTCYDFSAEGQWLDRDISCGPDGASDGDFHIGEIAHLAGKFMGLLERGYQSLTGRENADFWASRRFEHADWFELVGAIADGGNPGRDGTHDMLTTFAIGKGCEYTPKKSGYLYCFANDAWGFYDNNRGFVTVTIEAKPLGHWQRRA